MTNEEAIEYATEVIEQWKGWAPECSEQYQFYKLSIEILEKVRDGRMIELPCKVGEYVLWDFGICPKAKVVEGFCIGNDGFGLRLMLDDCSPIINHRAIKGFSPTKEEAEKALKEMSKK